MMIFSITNPLSQKISAKNEKLYIKNNIAIEYKDMIHGDIALQYYINRIAYFSS